MRNPIGTTETLNDMYGHIRIEEKDMLGRTFKTTDAKGNKTFIEYDEFGRVSKESGEIDEADGADSIKSYEYDNMNRLVKTYTDEPGKTVYEYDKKGYLMNMQ